jgi:pimeloyl-ACP methyl ester carboxylesterase
MFRRIVSHIACLALIATVAAPTAAAAPTPGPTLQTHRSDLQQALTCNGELSTSQRDPVLLVHGTFADSEINWSWNYKEALPARGEPACTVDLPNLAAGDIQVSTEYVVYAIRTMAKESGRKVAVIGHSQGGLETRWALRWWPDLRHKVSDVIMLATPNQGSAFPDGLCTSPGICAASLYQMRSDSKFLAALNHGRDAIGGVSFTSIVTDDDQIFVLPEQGMLGGHSHLISNVALQDEDLCPDHHFQPAELAHVSLAFDGVAYALVVDALDHRGAADPSRIDPSVCNDATMPGVTLNEAYAKVADYAATLTYLLGPDGPKADGEPRLACYATHTCRRRP